MDDFDDLFGSDTLGTKKAPKKSSVTTPLVSTTSTPSADLSSISLRDDEGLGAFAVTNEPLDFLSSGAFSLQSPMKKDSSLGFGEPTPPRSAFTKLSVQDEGPSSTPPLLEENAFAGQDDGQEEEKSSDDDFDPLGMSFP